MNQKDIFALGLEKEELTEYYKYVALRVGAGLFLAVVGEFIKNKSFYGEYVIGVVVFIVVWLISDVVQQKTLFHRRRKSLRKGRQEAHEILKSAGIKKHEN
jgi:hypothetical protein